MGSILPSSRGGKTPHALRNEEGVAAEDDQDVVMPARERAALEVVQAQLSLEFLVGALGAPALLHDAHDLLLRHAPRQGGEDELHGLRLALGAPHHEPHRLSIASIGAVVIGDLHAAKCEARGEIAAGPLAPGKSPERTGAEADPELLSGQRGSVSTVDRVQRPDLRSCGDRDAEVQAEHPHGVPEVARPTVRGVDEHDVTGDLILDGAGDEVEGQVGLRLEHEVVGDSCLVTPNVVVGPRSSVYLRSRSLRPYLPIRTKRRTYPRHVRARQDPSAKNNLLSLHAGANAIASARDGLVSAPHDRADAPQGRSVSALAYVPSVVACASSWRAHAAPIASTSSSAACRRSSAFANSNEAKPAGSTGGAAPCRSRRPAGSCPGLPSQPPRPPWWRSRTSEHPSRSP